MMIRINTVERSVANAAKSMHRRSFNKNIITLIFFMCIASFASAQKNAEHWADSVMKTLSKDERIAQLMVVRLSTYDSKTKKVTFFDQQVSDLVKKYNVGGVCLFQGSPTRQAELVNSLQAQARTPIMMCVDAEWGLGMRMIDSVLPLPRQMMLGAMSDATVVYQYGRVVAEQCKRVGIHVNYAPVVDVNNNPNNPVINDRSFGEDKYKVAEFGIAYMKGMQENGVMACAKHFPGHGDVAVDSHYDLPIINKSIKQLDSLELYPFRKIFGAGIGSAMIAHLYIPSIDNRPNRATSISANNIKGLLRDSLKYNGLTFTDALEMQGVKKFFPDGDASVESLIAGNDMLCLPGDVPLALDKIKKAIKAKKLKWSDIDFHCRRVLIAKYNYGIPFQKPVNLQNVTADLNKDVADMRKLVAENAITLVSSKTPSFFPLSADSFNKPGDVAVLVIGSNSPNAFSERIRNAYNAHVFFFDYTKKSQADIDRMVADLSKYKMIVSGVHNTTRSAATNYGISTEAFSLLNQLQASGKAITFLFANAYASKNICDAANLVVAYEDDPVVQNVAADMLQGILPYKGKLPVTVCDKFRYGTGKLTAVRTLIPGFPYALGFSAEKLLKIDSVVDEAIAKGALPGAVVMVLKDGKIAYNKAFGHMAFDSEEHVRPETIYDMASVTKVCATTISVMKLYDEGKIDLNRGIGEYIPWLRGSGKGALSLKRVLLHQAGLVSFIPFYKEVLNADGSPMESVFRKKKDSLFSVHVADGMYMRSDWTDTLYSKIATSKLGAIDKYVYSDNDFIILGKIVEAVSGLPLDEYVRRNFYQPMGLSTIGFNPLERVGIWAVAPTEREKNYRQQLLRGYVHDPGAAMFGGVSGHAGLFSNAYELAAIMQMLLNGGSFNGKQFIKPETVQLFTAYQSDISRRGYGFDKPEKDNATRKEPYPAKEVSPLTFGHTGFTGTCVWADPKENLVFIFLGNRVNAANPNLFLRLNVRGEIQRIIYEALATSKSAAPMNN